MPYDDEISLLTRLLKNLTPDTKTELSFKMADNAFEPLRFIYSVKTINIESPKHILDICLQLKMPAVLYNHFQLKLMGVMTVHFGCDVGMGDFRYKIYLELPPPKNIKKTEERLMMMGFKWSPFNNDKFIITDYIGAPKTPINLMREKAFKVLSSLNDIRLYEIISLIFNLVERRNPNFASWYLDVKEKNNPRKSFDIKFYDAMIKLDRIYNVLLELCNHFNIDKRYFYKYFDGISEHKLGHLSSGLDREGKGFVTIYHAPVGLAL